MNRLLLILLLIPSIGKAQVKAKQSLGLQVIGLGLSINYERLICDNHSLALVYGRDLQYAGDSRYHQGNIFRLQYRFRFGPRHDQAHLRAGVLASAYLEHAANRLLKGDFQRAQYQRAAIGGMFGYRLLVGKNQRVAFEVLLGPKYRIPYFEIPEWYKSIGGAFPMDGFTFEGMVGIFFLLGTTNKSS